MSGRPVLNFEDKRNKKVTIYLNEKEKEQYYKIKSSLSGELNMNDYFRKILSITNDNLLIELGMKNKIETISNDYIFVSELLEKRNISLNYFHKQLNKIGYPRAKTFNLSELLILKEMLPTNHYKIRLLLLNIDEQIEKLKSNECPLISL